HGDAALRSRQPAAFGHRVQEGRPARHDRLPDASRHHSSRGGSEQSLSARMESHGKMKRLEEIRGQMGKLVREAREAAGDVRERVEKTVSVSRSVFGQARDVVTRVIT